MCWGYWKHAATDHNYVSVLLKIAITSLSHLVVFAQDLSHKFVLRMVNSFDNESIVARVIKKTSTFSRGANFAQDILVR